MAKSTGSSKSKKGNAGIPDLSALFSQLNASTEGVSQLMGSLDQVAAVTSQFNIRKRLSLRTAKRTIHSYIEMLGDIVQTLATTKLGTEDKALKEILGYQETMSETIEENTRSIKDGQAIDSKRNKISSDGRYPLIDFMGSFANMISGIVEPMQKIMSGSVFNMFGFFRKRANDLVMDFSIALQFLIESLFNAATSIDSTKLNAAMSVLVGDPEVVSKSISKVDKSTTGADKVTSNNIQEDIKEVTTGRKMGVLEMITGFLTVFNTISTTLSLGLVAGLIMRKKIARFAEYFKLLITSLVNIFPAGSFGENSENTKKKYDTLGKVFENITNIITSITMLEIPSVAKILITVFRIFTFRKALIPAFSGLVKDLNEVIIDSESINKDENGEAIEGVINIIGELNNLVVAFFQLKKRKVRRAAKSARLISDLFIPAITEMIEKINDINKINPDSLKSISGVIKDMKELASSIIFAALLAVPFAIAVPIVIFEAWLIKHLVGRVNKIFSGIGKMAPLLTASIAVSVAVIGAIALVMVLVTGSLLLIALMIKPIFKNALIILGGIGVIIVILGALTTLFAVMGFLMLPAVLGAAAALVIVTSMTIIVVEMIALMGLLMIVELISRYVDQEAIGTAVDTVLGTADAVITKVLNYDFGKRRDAASNTGIVGGLAKMFLGGQATSILDLASKIIILFLTIIAVTTLILLVVTLKLLVLTVDKYKEILKVDGSDGAAVTAVQDVMTTANAVISAIFNSEGEVPGGKDEHGGLLHTIIGWVSPDLADMVSLALKAIVVILTIIVVGMVFILVHELKTLNDYIKEIKSDEIVSNVKNLMTTISSIVSTILNSNLSFGESKEEDQGWFSKVARTILPDSLVNIADMITKLGQFAMAFMVLGAAAALAKAADSTVQILNKYSKAPENLSTKLNNLVSGVVTAMKSMSISEDDKNTIMAFAQDTSGVENFGKIQVSMDKMVNKVNGLNIDKMKAFAEMWGNAAAFAKSINGNFDKLADVLTEKIAPLIQDLKNTIKDADNHATQRASQAPTLAPAVATTTVPVQPTPQPIVQQPVTRPTSPLRAQIEDKETEIYNAIVKALEARNLGS